MEQETTKVMKAKDYKRAGKAEAVSYIQRKKSVKGDERKAVVKEQKQKIRTLLGLDMESNEQNVNQSNCTTNECQ